jgi:hypothetical protein
MIRTKTTKSNQTERANQETPRERSGAASKNHGAKTLAKRATRKRVAGAVRPPRTDNKQQLCLDLLRRPEGASIEDLRQATGWQAHSVRGFLSGAVKRKLGLELRSHKPEHQPRRYRIPQATA